MKRKTTILKKIKKKTSAFLNNDNPKKRKFKEYNGMLLLEVHSYWQQVAKGLILILAVGAETIKQIKED